MSRPVIGICAALERARWSVWDEEAVLLPRSYLTAVEPDGLLVTTAGQYVRLIECQRVPNTITADASELVAAEPEIVAHMNTDHAAAARLYATKLLGAPDGPWRCVGCDPEGLELQLGRTALRLPFPQRVRAPGVLRRVLKQLAEEAKMTG